MGGFAPVRDALGQVWVWSGFVPAPRRALTCCGSVSIRGAFVPFPALNHATKPPLFSYILFLDKTEISELRNKLSINLHLIRSAEIYGIIPRQEKSSARCPSEFPFLIVSSSAAAALGRTGTVRVALAALPAAREGSWVWKCWSRYNFQPKI